MNPTKYDTFRLTISSRDLKKRFCKVYKNVISNSFIFNEQLIWNVKEILRSPKEAKNFETDLSDYQLSFLLSFGVQDTCLAVETFYESAMNCTRIIENISNKNKINLFCVLSESLPTTIGVCQVIDEIVGRFAYRRRFDYEIRVTVIDERESWRHVCGSIVDTVNAYLKYIEIKLDFVDYFMDWSWQELPSRLREIDLMIEARIYVENWIFPQNYSFMQVARNEMQKDAVLFYFDSCNEKYYKQLKHIFLQSFSQVKWCSDIKVSFEDLEEEEFRLDLPINWQTDFEPVMFSTWIKTAIPKIRPLEIIAASDIASQSNSQTKKKTKAKGKKKGKSKKKHSISDASIVATTNSDILSIENKSCPTNTVDVSHIASTIPTKQVSASKEAKSSQITNVVISPKRTGKAKNLVNPSKVVNCNDASFPTAQTMFPKKENITSEVLSASAKKITSNKEGQKKTENSKVTSSMMKETMQKIETMMIRKYISSINSAYPTAEIILPKKENKTVTSKVTSASTKKTTSNKDGQKKKTENGKISSSVTKETMLKKENIVKSEKSIKSNTDSESKTSKDKCKTKSSNSNVSTPTAEKVKLKKPVPVKLTKKSVKSFPTDKVRLTGKFARMDLEKKNKDERHKMRAKQASFSKHANFDYDD